MYSIISLFRSKPNSKNKIPDDLYKALKTAHKLEKEIESTTQQTIEEIEKENVNNLNSKQLESVCKLGKPWNDNAPMYHNLKQIQV